MMMRVLGFGVLAAALLLAPAQADAQDEIWIQLLNFNESDDLDLETFSTDSAIYASVGVEELREKLDELRDQLPEILAPLRDSIGDFHVYEVEFSLGFHAETGGVVRAVLGSAGVDAGIKLVLRRQVP